MQTFAFSNINNFIFKIEYILFLEVSDVKLNFLFTDIGLLLPVIKSLSDIKE